MFIQDYHIIESTLREGEQFVNAFFTSDQKVRIANLLDNFGVEYIELTTPLASPQSENDCRIISALNLNARILTHTRCNLEDVKRAIDTGVDGVDIVIGTSSHLREFSHGKEINQIRDMVQEVFEYLAPLDIESRFSTEDSLRSEFDDIISLYEMVDQLGVNRVGIADTIGVGTPREIYSLVSSLRENVNCDIEFHGHNDTGCAIANAYSALEAGCTHVDTSVLGIGERNGITSLGGLIACLHARDRNLTAKYNLPILKDLDILVAELVNVDVPFNNSITGFSAFTHKAGIHAKAVLNDPSTYEAIDPADFGLKRYIHIAHRLTGWNAVKNRADQLGITIDAQQAKKITERIKFLSDKFSLTLDDVDMMLHNTSSEYIEVNLEKVSPSQSTD
ncbi:MAG: homocitrate synthase [Anaerolineaceae bacterium]|nr:homocitrate synthase [Anaerolineaceae bacterium]